ncbi:uncharacterized protein RAG0_15801 [Rhynchosporium agropyri]|uniref:RNase H type-1 domain-containing protein n=1 Tax=Rhynchosporium agropyri TaxID=914238 RepID=A0A1E1LMM3_9HELO|nr:uncharacterized protein RAG0_15801 [Rhynchosporium agropyri]
MDDHDRVFNSARHGSIWYDSHPSTRRYLASDPYSLLIFIDRDIRHRYHLIPVHHQASWAILCQTTSRFNRAHFLPRDHVQSIEVAELFALAQGLEVALEMVRAGSEVSRVVFCTHSQLLMDRICTEAWIIDQASWPPRVAGELVEWIHVLHDCHLMIQALIYGRGVAVDFWHAPISDLVETHGLLERFL